MTDQIDCEVSRILGRNARILEICRLIKIVGKTDCMVLLQGENGTGKELVANAIHAHSPRAKKLIIEVNCAAVSETLLERRLFGYKMSALTGRCETLLGGFEAANGGTMVLDKIGNISLSTQAKLLRVLDKGEIFLVGSKIPVKIDARVIATTSVDLKKAVKQGAFRDDLYYHVNAITFFLPPLRKRKEDIPFLVKNFITLENFETKRHIEGITSKAMDILMAYEWPGNVRELKMAIEHAVIVENTNIIQHQSLPHYICKGFGRPPFQDAEEFNLKRRVTTYERQLILRALTKADWVKSQAAKLLGIDQRNLGYFIRKHHIVNLEERRRLRGM